MSQEDGKSKSISYVKFFLKPKIVIALVFYVLCMYLICLLPWIIPDTVKGDLSFIESISRKEPHIYASIGFLMLSLVGFVWLFLDDTE